MSLYEKMLSDFSIDNIYENMDVLVNEIGERLSGSAEMVKATEYINSQLKKKGLDSHIDHFPMYQSYPKEAMLKIISPEEKEIEARPVCHIESTAEAGIEGELIYLGSGRYEDYKGIDVRNKIVLTNMNWSPGRPEKARIAWEMGAKALIIMNWGKAEDNLIQMGAVKAQWGNPTPETEKDIVRLTVISISRGDGEYLAKLCKEENVKVWLKAEATREWIKADQPMARVEGGKSNGQYVLVGSHVDAWGKSAICNASGNAVNMELARLFNKYKDELKRDIVFVFWDGHEIAEGGGSTWYCDNYWQDMDKNCIAYINIDNLAIQGTTIPGVESLPELKDILMGAIKKIFGVEGLWHHAYKGGGDSSFFGIGVPYISFATEYTEELLEELNYAFYSPWLHSDADTIDKLDKGLLEKHFEYFMYIIEKIATANTVPYDIKALAADVRNQYEEILKRSGRALEMISTLEPLVKKYVECADTVEKFRIYAEGDDKKDDLFNKVALYFERKTADFRCESGRYGQDSCCSLQTENPIPALEKAIKSYNNAEKYSHEYYLWETQILRIRNRVADALTGSVDFAKLALKDKI